MRKKQTLKTVRSRCHIIIDLDETHGKVLTHEQSAKTNCVCMSTITNAELIAEPYFYAVTNLDRKGGLEIIQSSGQGTGLYTYTRLWGDEDEMELNF